MFRTHRTALSLAAALLAALASSHAAAVTFVIDEFTLGSDNIAGVTIPLTVDGLTMTVTGNGGLDNFLQVDADGIFLVDLGDSIDLTFDQPVTVLGYVVDFTNSETTGTYDFVNSDGTSSLGDPGAPAGSYTLGTSLDVLPGETLNLEANVTDVSQIRELTVTVIPEPASLALLGLGGLLLARRRRRDPSRAKTTTHKPGLTT